jgi:hypothetical protein
MPGSADQDLQQALERIISESQSIGREWVTAGSRLARGEVLPSTDLVHRLEALRSEWGRLLALATMEKSGGPVNPVAPPDPETSLSEAVAFVESALAYRQRRVQQQAVRGIVLDRLSKIMRLEAQAGAHTPKLSELRTEAQGLEQCVRECEDLGSLEEFTALADGTHRYCHLLALIEPAENPGLDRAKLGMLCALSFGYEVTEAAVDGRLAVAGPVVAEVVAPAPSTTSPPPHAAETGREPPETPPENVGATPAPKEPPAKPAVSPAAQESVARTESQGPRSASSTRPTTAPNPRLAAPPKGSRRRSLEDQFRLLSIGHPVSKELSIRVTAPVSENPPPFFSPESKRGAEWSEKPKEKPDPASPTIMDTVAERSLEVDSALTTEEEPFPLETPLDELPPESSMIGFVASEESTLADDQTVNVAVCEEILSHCRSGDYLVAVLLAVGRVFAGLRDCDPSPEALLAVHYVANGSSTAPWPVWCHGPDSATVASEQVPEASRLVLLATLYRSARVEGGGDSITLPVMKCLLAAFNHLPDLRNWLEDVLDAVSIPGLWEQVCLPESTLALDVYKETRNAFMERYEVGLQHRNPNAAYIHRQDHYMSRLPATKLLHDHLKPDEPGPLQDDEEQKIRDLLVKRPADITNDWLRSAIRPATGGIQLKGNQKVDLIKRAAVYLERISRAWRAAEVLRRSDLSPGEIERRRARFLATLPDAREQSRGTPSDALFVRLTEGFQS